MRVVTVLLLCLLVSCSNKDNISDLQAMNLKKKVVSMTTKGYEAKLGSYNNLEVDKTPYSSINYVFNDKGNYKTVTLRNDDIVFNYENNNLNSLSSNVHQDEKLSLGRNNKGVFTSFDYIKDSITNVNKFSFKKQGDELNLNAEPESRYLFRSLWRFDDFHYYDYRFLEDNENTLLGDILIKNARRLGDFDKLNIKVNDTLVQVREYDDNHLEIKRTYLNDLSRSLTKGHINYEYNDHHDVLKAEVNFEESYVNLFTFKYFYDKNDNWIVKLLYLDDEIKNVVTRDIEYENEDKITCTKEDFLGVWFNRFSSYWLDLKADGTFDKGRDVLITETGKWELDTSQNTIKILSNSKADKRYIYRCDGGKLEFMDLNNNVEYTYYKK